MTTLKFIVSLSTGVSTGKKQKIKKGTRNNMAMTLMANPYLPRENLDRGKGGSVVRRRREIRHPMERM